MLAIADNCVSVELEGNCMKEKASGGWRVNNWSIRRIGRVGIQVEGTLINKSRGRLG